MLSHILIILSLLPFYLLGAIPAGYLVAKRGGVDITTQGSGNVGATNVARVIGKQAGVITLCADIAKGLLGTLAASWLSTGSWYVALAAVAIVAGHCFSVPPFLKGGKGVATALGVFLAIEPLAALLGLAVFVAVFLISRIVSLSSVCAILVAPFWMLFGKSYGYTAYSLVIIALLIVYAHRHNLVRISEGTERKFSCSSDLKQK